MFRKCCIFFLSLLFFVFFVIPAFASSNDSYQGHPVVKVVIDGNEVQSDVPAILVGGRALVPVRALCEALGIQVEWDAATNTVKIAHPDATSAAEPSGDKVIRVGLIAPLSGDVQVFGQSVVNGFNLLMKEKNSKVGPFRLEVIAMDDRNSPTEAVNAAMNLITREKVDVIVGAVTSKCSIPVSEICQHYEIPMITPTSTNPRVTVDQNKRKAFIFRTCITDPAQGAMAAKFASQNLKARTAAVLYDQGNDYTIVLADCFKDAFEKWGCRVTVFEPYDAFASDFTEVLRKVVQAKPDILYLPDYYPRANLICKHARQLGIRAVFLGADGWDSQYLDLPSLEGSYYTNYYALDDPNPQMVSWVAKYRDMYRVDPDIFAAAGYDTAQVLIKAIEVAGSGDPLKIRDALQNTKDFATLNGSLSFDQDGNPVKPVVILKVKQGKAVYETTVAP